MQNSFWHALFRAFVTKLMILPPLYMASFGPACWMLTLGIVTYDDVMSVYWPFLGRPISRLIPALGVLMIQYARALSNDYTINKLLLEYWKKNGYLNDP